MSKFNNSAEFLILSKTYDRLGKLISATMAGASGGTYQWISQFTVDGGGGAPTDGETEYLNPSLTEDIAVHKQGVGYLVEGTDYDVIVGGGFELLIGEFTTGEVYTTFKRNS